MAIREIEAGTVIYDKGQETDAFYLIMRGAVRAIYPGGSYLLHSGDVIGLCEAGHDAACMKYVAEEKTAINSYGKLAGHLKEMLERNTDAVKYFQSSLFAQLNEMIGKYKVLRTECGNLYQYLKNSYEAYRILCQRGNIPAGMLPGYEELEKPETLGELPGWISGYYATIEQMLAVWDHNNTDNDFICGFLLKAGEDMQRIIAMSDEMQEYKEEVCRYLVNENSLDLFGLYARLYMEETQDKGALQEGSLALKLKVNEILSQVEKHNILEPDLCQKRREGFEKEAADLEKQKEEKTTDDKEDQNHIEEISGSLDKILKYAECGEQIEAEFRKYVMAYKRLPNKEGTEDDVRAVRLQLTKLFYKVYIAAFQVSVKEREIPSIVKMFFEFGYVDEELAGIKNALYLYRLVQNMPTAPEKGVYSAFQWLMAIYTGKKEPGRNEFDMDYTEYLREQKKNGKITQAQEAALLNNNGSKVMYELENVFPIVNKITYGRPSIFCPVFSEHNILKPLNTSLVTGEKVLKVIDEIRRLDHSVFYRETMYSEPDKGIPREIIAVEVLPDIILTPNIGTRGIMWQEIEGKKRTTPARMMSSVFQLEDLSMIFMQLAGEFRWEMCKRIQGSRWNDVSEPSLTSEYCDYVQFYRKNKDLSADAKEKIKAQLGRARNSFKEMFISDYIVWLCYESTGSPRLNKVARMILFTYCPFTKEIRNKLTINPLYREIVDRYDIRNAQKLHHMNNLYQRLGNMGKQVPEEIEEYKRFLER